MNISESLQGVTRIFLDTAPIIYFVEANLQYLESVRYIFNQVENGDLIGVTSSVTLAECLVYPYRLGQIKLAEKFINTILYSNHMIFTTNNHPNIAINAAKIRARYNLQLPDAFQISFAINTECEAFITNDLTFKRITELRILVLNDFQN
ncbi:MAG: type II toxin-antitoxin system VapC family toxin [Sphaerospermopsis sp. SIO1G1]|nr:type II toxin-antitoxin system VapC family toxin [Sphaerospermopsis sp. SIO1G1]